jgi:uncharacterized protein (DUF1684 family)
VVDVERRRHRRQSDALYRDVRDMNGSAALFSRSMDSRGADHLSNELGFFLPFVDLSGVETYGAGRYLEPVERPDGRFEVDFNLAYNPYCAYNENWSCPITPAENRLRVPIRAGEMVFDHES